MLKFREALFVGDDSETPTSVQCYDVHLGVRIMTYKNGRGVSRNAIGFIHEDYIITADSSKPFLHVWSVSKEEPFKRMSVPGKATALAVSPNGIYCAAGIENKIYIWNIPTGQLLNVVSYHHEPITKIAFWNCLYLITCGADGLVAVWRLVDILSKETGSSFSMGNIRHFLPYFSSSQHSLPVMDMHIACSGSTARLFTVSSDQTCQIFSLGADGGKFLLTMTFEYILTSIAVDRLQRKLFVGTDCGRIVSFALEPCHDTTMRFVDSSDDGNCLMGHTESVNCLCLSREDTILASGSSDKKVILWNLSTGQQISVHQMFGSVTNLVFRVMTEDFLTTKEKPNSLMSVFERNVTWESENLEIKVLVKNDLSADFGPEKVWMQDKPVAERRSSGLLPAAVAETRGDNLEEAMDAEEGDSAVCEDNRNESSTFVNGGCSSDELSRLRQQNRELKSINRRLYMYALEQCLQNGHIKRKP